MSEQVRCEVGSGHPTSIRHGGEQYRWIKRSPCGCDGARCAEHAKEVMGYTAQEWIPGEPNLCPAHAQTIRYTSGKDHRESRDGK